MKVGMCQGFHFSTMVALFCASAAQVWCAPAATTTTLAITSGGNAVTTVSSGSMVTLTATVVAGTTPVTVGQVNFCDAAAKYCTDIHIVGTAQLIQTGANRGTAVFRFIPGIGNHSYNAVFAGTPNAATAYAASTSANMALAVTVTGTLPTSTTLWQASGNAGNYSLSATVYGTGKTAPTGTVSFLDTSSANALLGTATLDAGTQEVDLVGSWFSVAGLSSQRISLSIADFNGDGILDLAVVNNGLDVITILLGKGDGTFAAGPTNPAAGIGPNSLAVGDFNGDGILDLAVTNPCGSNPNCDIFGKGSVTILLGKGDGTFEPGPAGPATGTRALFIATGDFNGDGVLDLAVSNINQISETDATGSIEIFLGKGDGTFSATAKIVPTGIPYPFSTLWVGDLNGDGLADLVLSEPLTVFLSNGDGTFTAAASPATSGGPIAIGDFNGDGKLDLMTGTAVLLGNGDGTFKAISGPPAYGNDVAVGDFNGDGIADLAINYPSGDCTVYGDGIVAVLLGNGDGTFKGAGETGSASFMACADSIVVGDFTGAGIEDLALVGPTLIGSGQPTPISIVLPQMTETATATGISPVGNGTHQVEASYSGDSNYGSSISSAIPLTALPKPDFAIGGAAVSIAAGATTGNTASVTVTPAGGFTGSVTLTAKITAQPNGAAVLPTLSFGATTPLSITGAAAGTATLAISTTASSSCTAANRVQRSPVSWAGSGALLACVFLFLLPARRRRWQSMLGSLLLLAATCCGVLACGGGSSIAACTAVAGTTPGNYTITVTGISGAITETSPISLTVK
jgi:hypothetical protein